MTHPSLIENIRKEFDKFCDKDISCTYPINYSNGTEAIGIDGATTKQVADWWISHLTHTIEVEFNRLDYKCGNHKRFRTILATLKEIQNHEKNN